MGMWKRLQKTSFQVCSLTREASLDTSPDMFLAKLVIRSMASVDSRLSLR